AADMRAALGPEFRRMFAGEVILDQDSGAVGADQQQVGPEAGEVGLQQEIAARDGDRAGAGLPDMGETGRSFPAPACGPRGSRLLVTRCHDPPYPFQQPICGLRGCRASPRTPLAACPRWNRGSEGAGGSGWVQLNSMDS